MKCFSKKSLLITLIALGVGIALLIAFKKAELAVLLPFLPLVLCGAMCLSMIFMNHGNSK